MKSVLLNVVVASLLVGSVSAENALKYDFNDCTEKSLEGQSGWAIFPKVKDSTSVSIVDEVGATEVAGDYALVMLPADSKMRCVSGDAVRWMPGNTLTMEFDFKVVTPSEELFSARPVLSVFIGNSLLSTKSRWNVRFEALPSGDWQLVGALPDRATKVVYAENFLIRQDDAFSVSKWFKFVIVVEKLSEPDEFKAWTEIKNASGRSIAKVEFTDSTKDKLTATMWNLSRLHVGFGTEINQYGLVDVDNIEVSVSE